MQTPTSQNVLKELNPATANTTETGAAVAVVNSNLNGLKSILLNDYARALYGQPYVHSTWEHMKSGVARQHVINKRNTGFIIPRVIQAIFMSLVISSVFYDTAMDKVSNRVALMFFTITATAFGNMGELPMVVESKRVLYKQTESGMFPTAVYVISVILCHMPLLLLDAIIWSIVVYFVRPPSATACATTPATAQCSDT